MTRRRHGADAGAIGFTLVLSALVAFAAAEQFDALFVPTSNWTCTATACPVVVGNVLMYRDDSHLTATAADLLTPYVEALVGALR